MNFKNRASQFLSIFLALTISGQAASQMPAQELVSDEESEQSEEMEGLTEKSDMLSGTYFFVGTVVIVAVATLVSRAFKKGADVQKAINGAVETGRVNLPRGAQFKGRYSN